MVSCFTNWGFLIISECVWYYWQSVENKDHLMMNRGRTNTNTNINTKDHYTTDWIWRRCTSLMFPVTHATQVLTTTLLNASRILRPNRFYSGLLQSKAKLRVRWDVVQNGTTVAKRTFRPAMKQANTGHTEIAVISIKEKCPNITVFI